MKNQNNIKHIAHTIQDVNIHCVGICMSWHTRVQSGVRNFRFLNEQIRCGHFTFFSDNWYTASWRIIINFLCCTWFIEKQKKKKKIEKSLIQEKKKGKIKLIYYEACHTVQMLIYQNDKNKKKKRNIAFVIMLIKLVGISV